MLCPPEYSSWHPAEENLIVKFSGPDFTNNINIAPFILITFVENAFKHISHFNSQSNLINIDIKIEKGILLLYVENTFDGNSKFKNTSSQGIGLQNVKRRMELLYPEKYSLLIENNNLLYTVKLNLDLNKD